jgi:hypothetical protein
MPFGGVPLDLLTFTNQKMGNMKATDGQFYLDVVYSDALNQLKTRARFHIARIPDPPGGPDMPGTWVTASIEYFTPPDAPTSELSARFR